MQIRHDFHIHTHLSRCAKETATVEGYLDHAKRLGLRKLGFSDHFWDEKIEGANTFYQPQNLAHVLSLKPTLEAAAAEGIQLFFGCETEYDPVHHGVAITEETAEQFDFILVPNSHTHMMMPKDFYQPYEKHIEFMINAFHEILDSPVSRYITAIAHPFEAVACPYDKTILIDMISDDTFKRLFSKSAEKNVAFEINVSSMLHKTPEQIESAPQMRMFRIARDCGCKFIFGSDAHGMQSHSRYENATLVANLLALTPDDIVNIAAD